MPAFAAGMVSGSAKGARTSGICPRVARWDAEGTAGSQFPLGPCQRVMKQRMKHRTMSPNILLNMTITSFFVLDSIVKFKSML